MRRVEKHQLAQLKTYTLLAWRNGYRVHRAHIATHNKLLHTMTVDQQVLQDAETLAARLWDTIENPDPPITNQPPEKCSYCRYNKLCPQRSTTQHRNDPSLTS